MSNEFLSQFQIIGSCIKNVKIKNDFVSLGNGGAVKRKIDVSHTITSLGTSEDEQTITGTIQVNIKAVITVQKKKYSIELAIEGCFDAPAEIGEERFKEMLQVNGLTSLYSIARGFVHSTTSQTLVSGSVLLPMFNVAAYSKDLDSSENDT